MYCPAIDFCQLLESLKGPNLNLVLNCKNKLVVHLKDFSDFLHWEG